MRQRKLKEQQNEDSDSSACSAKDPLIIREKEVIINDSYFDYFSIKETS